MINKAITAALLWSAGALSPGFAVAAAEPPSASIGNGAVTAKLWLPNVKDGYYRSTRFDWSGSVWSLESGGHSYFGQWFPRYDPLVHDSITGPVEDYAPLNYTEAKPGETFVKIGIGVLKKIDDQPYRFSTLYDLLDTGKWAVRTGPDFVEYRHEVTDPKSGYGYIYTKTVRLTAGKQQMTIDHTLRNTGTKAIETNVYNHGFFMLDSQPTGPDITVTFPFDAKAVRSMSPAAEVTGKQIVYLQELQPRANAAATAAGAPPAGTAPRAIPARDGGRGGSPTGASSGIEGFSLTDPKDWSTRTTVCPEAYVEVKAEPGKEFSWRLTYDFYSLPPSGR